MGYQNVVPFYSTDAWLPVGQSGQRNPRAFGSDNWTGKVAAAYNNYELY